MIFTMCESPLGSFNRPVNIRFCEHVHPGGNGGTVIIEVTDTNPPEPLKKKKVSHFVWTDHLRWIPKAVKWKLAGIYFVQRWVILNCYTCVRQRLIIIKDLPSLQTEHDVGRFGLWRPFWWAALNCGAKLRSLRATNLANLFVNSSWKCVCEGPFVAQRFSSCHRDGFVVCACLSKSSHE